MELIRETFDNGGVGAVLVVSNPFMGEPCYHICINNLYQGCLHRVRNEWRRYPATCCNLSMDDFDAVAEMLEGFL